MTYRIAEPPFTLRFREMSREELRGYFQWFLNSIPGRIDELHRVVRTSPGYETWAPDETPTSLDPLGHWFAAQIETRARTQEELDEIRGLSPLPMRIPDQVLTNRVFSLALDIGMYLSQVFLTNFPSLRWELPLRAKMSIDYGQPVLAPFGRDQFNPAQMIVTFAYGLETGTRTAADLRRIYDTWSLEISNES